MNQVALPTHLVVTCHRGLHKDGTIEQPIVYGEQKVFITEQVGIMF